MTVGKTSNRVAPRLPSETRPVSAEQNVRRAEQPTQSSTLVAPALVGQDFSGIVREQQQPASQVQGGGMLGFLAATTKPTQSPEAHLGQLLKDGELSKDELSAWVNQHIGEIGIVPRASFSWAELEGRSTVGLLMQGSGHLETAVWNPEKVAGDGVTLSVKTREMLKEAAANLLEMAEMAAKAEDPLLELQAVAGRGELSEQAISDWVQKNLGDIGPIPRDSIMITDFIDEVTLPELLDAAELLEETAQGTPDLSSEDKQLLMAACDTLIRMAEMLNKATD